MKRLIIILCLCIGVSVAVNAQTWTAPPVPGESLDGLSSTDIVYVYNVEADAFAMYGMTSNNQVCATRLTNGDTKVTVPQQSYVFVEDGKVRIRNKERGGSNYFSCQTDAAFDVVMNRNVNPYFTYAETEMENVYTLTNTEFGKVLDVSWTYGGHLTLTDGSGQTKWAFIKEGNVSNGKYALYKAKRNMYAIYKALVDAGKATDYKDALDVALMAYSNNRATVESIVEASRKLFSKVYVDISGELNVSFLLENADMAGSMSAAGWGGTSPATGWGEMEVYHSAFTFEQDAIVPLGSYDLGFHSLYREDGSGSAPTLTVTTGKGRYSGKTPLMGTLDYGVTNTSSNNWSSNNGKIQPNGMQSCGQALAHGEAMAWAKGIAVDASGEMNVKYAVTSSNQWTNFQGFELIFKGVDRSELFVSLKSAIDQAMALYGNGSGIGADVFKATIDDANATYANSDASNKDVNEAISALTTAMADYRNGNASEENPIDKTGLIVNPSFEQSTNGWTVSGLVAQTNTSFAQKKGSTYMEKWVSTGNRVGNGSAIQNVIGMEVGVYQLKVAAQNIQQNSSVSQSGAWIFANGAKVSVNKAGEYTLTFVNIESEAEIGFKAENASGNWISVDNFRLYYIGNNADFKAELQKYIDTGKALAGKKMHTDAQEALASALAAAEAEIVKEGTAGYVNVSTPLRKAYEEAEKSVNAYGELFTAIEKAEKEYASNQSENLLNSINTAKSLYESGETSYEDLESIVAFLKSAQNNPNIAYQVISGISITDAVDFHIAGITPFATAGSVDIINPDAVVIIDQVKPSIVLARHMQNIYINGEKAQNNVNCQVRMYNTGAIIFPYGKNFKPLTVYSEQNFEGTAVNDFGLENSNGYMNTLTDAKLNNAIRSFKLKRGYMVTFSIGARGRGYSRCFIADHADLEFATLPAVLDKHITSYRVFKWNNAQKKGLASDTGAEGNQVLNSAWCYDWGPGQDRGVDTETVPHKIHKSWPAVADCGRVTYSPHMKTDNEPGNSADDQPGTVAEVLAYWEDAMATGMRLCSPSSHDGSLNWLREFMNEIDARGWRCDILDMHCYWPAGSFPSLQNWYNDYKRPIWISEFVWGASWNNNGIFAGDRSFSEAAQQANYEGMRPILENLNKWPFVERYAYWNSEADCSKIYKYGTGLSVLGEYYAEMNSGLGYNEAYQYIPKVVCKAPSDLTATMPPATKVVNLSWKHPNGELTKYAVVERKVENESNSFVAVNTIYDVENETMTVKDTLTGKSGAVYYRIKNYDVDGKTRTTNEVMVSIVDAKGTDFIKYGTLLITDLDAAPIEFNYPYEATPAVFTGLYTNKNVDAVPTSVVSNVTDAGFTYQLYPLQYQTKEVEFTNVEEVPFMALPQGNHTFGSMDIEVGTASVKTDTLEVKFNKPFPAGVKPVVLAELNGAQKSSPYFVRIWDVTNEGFKTITFREEGSASPVVIVAQPLSYAAFTPGTECIDEENGLVLSAGVAETDLYGSTPRPVYFSNHTINANGDTVKTDTLLLKEPIIFAEFQTFNYDAGVVPRTIADMFEKIDGVNYTIGTRIRRIVDSSKTGLKNNKNTADHIGWVTISQAYDNKEVGIGNVTNEGASIAVEVINRCIYVDGVDNFEVFTLSGTKVAPNATQEPGVYIVRSGKQVVKVIVK